MSELTFGNWVRLLSTGGHRNGIPVDYTKVLWRPYLSPRFSGAASRQALHTEAEAVRTFRNRIAHHEPLLSIDHARMLQRAVDLTEIINPVVADELRANTLIGQFIRNRPRRSCVAGCDHPRL